MLAGLILSKRSLPKWFAGPVECQRGVQTLDGGGEEDLLGPDGGRGASFAWQRRFPEDVS